jgi:hypothetical protein
MSSTARVFTLPPGGFTSIGQGLHYPPLGGFTSIGQGLHYPPLGGFTSIGQGLHYPPLGGFTSIGQGGHRGWTGPLEERSPFRRTSPTGG